MPATGYDGLLSSIDASHLPYTCTWCVYARHPFGSYVSGLFSLVIDSVHCCLWLLLVAVCCCLHDMGFSGSSLSLVSMLGRDMEQRLLWKSHRHPLTPYVVSCISTRYVCLHRIWLIVPLFAALWNLIALSNACLA